MTMLSISTPTLPDCPTCGGPGWLRLDVPYTHKDFGKPVECDHPIHKKAKQPTLTSPPVAPR